MVSHQYVGLGSGFGFSTNIFVMVLIESFNDKNVFDLKKLIGKVMLLTTVAFMKKAMAVVFAGQVAVKYRLPYLNY